MLRFLAASFLGPLAPRRCRTLACPLDELCRSCGEYGEVEPGLLETLRRAQGRQV